MEKQTRIKVKSLAWIEDNGYLFVVKMMDQVKQDAYYRPIGGTVEFGERAIDTVHREALEELGAEIQVTGEALVVENLFTCNGKAGHEIDYLFPSQFSDRSFDERKTYTLNEADGSSWDARWMKISDFLDGSFRLVPEALLEWYQIRKK